MSQVVQIIEDQSESITNLQNSDLITHEHVFPAFVLKYHNENLLPLHSMFSSCAHQSTFLLYLDWSNLSTMNIWLWSVQLEQQCRPPVWVARDPSQSWRLRPVRILNATRHHSQYIFTYSHTHISTLLHWVHAVTTDCFKDDWIFWGSKNKS